MRERPTRWFKWRDACGGRHVTSSRAVDPESWYGRCYHRYYRRLVAYYIFKARLHLRCEWRYYRESGGWWYCERRVLRCCASIRRLRERAENIEQAWLRGEWPLGIEPPEAGKRIGELRARAEQAERERDAARQAELVALSSGSECNTCEAKASVWHEALDELATIHNRGEVERLRGRYPRKEEDR